jgi:hypothetical protein
MTINIPTQGNWKPHTKDKDDIMFMSVNLNSLFYWSRDCNKAERLKHIFKKYKINSAGLQEVYMNLTHLPPSKTLAQSFTQQKRGQIKRGREDPMGRHSHNFERRTNSVCNHFRSRSQRSVALVMVSARRGRRVPHKLLDYMRRI